ncbi:MAG TPA: hypothetical protein VLS47_00145 [Gallionella sp.]|nr:hypothetical protein [Gallionella sp.]
MVRSTGLAGMAAMLFLPGGTAMADDTQAAASVGVYAQHSGDKIVYHYRVSNNSQQNINAVTIGHDNQNDGNPNNDVNELVELPSGWNPKLGIPSTSANSPTGWRVSVLAPEEGEAHAISWEPLNERSPKLLAGQSVSKMSVSLDKADNNYLSGHAMVVYSDGNPASLTVPLERLDTSPPSLTVILSPDTLVSQNSKLAAINVSFAIKDDYDRMPAIKLESITSGEPLGADDIRDASFGLDDRYFKVLAESKSLAGRIYTVTYSATDASGNQTIASATVTVTTPAAASGMTPASALEGAKQAQP